MKIPVTSMLLAAAMFGAPMLFAQAQPKGGEGEGKPTAEKTDEELEAEFKRLAAEISRSMGTLESEIARASLPPRTAAELKAELDAMIEQIAEGKSVRVGEGLKTWLTEDQERLAKILGTNAETTAALAADQAELLKKLQSRSEQLKESLEESNGIQKVLEAQLKAEEKLAELIKTQQEQAKLLDKKMEDIIVAAKEMRDRAPP